MKKYIPGESKAERKQRKTIEKLKKLQSKSLDKQTVESTNISNNNNLDTNKNLNSPIAFVLGNGISRKDIDIILFHRFVIV